MSQILKFEYLPMPQSDPVTGNPTIIYRPMVPIKIVLNHKLTKFPFWVLLDSGADRNLFPATIADSLGIKIVNKRPILHEGIGKSALKAYEHEATIFVDTKRIETTIDFSVDHEVPLLGRTGFFKFFKSVIFHEKEIDGYVELEL